MNEDDTLPLAEAFCKLSKRQLPYGNLRVIGIF